MEKRWGEDELENDKACCRGCVEECVTKGYVMRECVKGYMRS